MDLLRRIFLRILHLPVINKVVQKLFPYVVGKKKENMTLEDAKKRVTGLAKRPKTHVYYDTPLEELDDASVVLSVIIPCYNSAEYIDECLNSVISQKTGFNFEIVVVDDGSKDNSSEILDSWAEKYPEIYVYHQNNSGVAVARNKGVELSKGKYIMFLDSDDCLFDNALDVLVSKALEKDADIVEGSYEILMGNSNKTRKGMVHSDSENSKGKGMYGFPWGKVFKRNLFLRFCFPPEYWCEDAIIANLIFPNANKTVTVSDSIVKYRLNSMGLTAQLRNGAKCVHIYYIMEELLDTYIKFSIEYNKSLTVRQLGQYMYTRCRALKEKDIKAVFVLACDLSEKFDLSTGDEEYCFYEKQILEALKNRQYSRWKWASLLI